MAKELVAPRVLTQVSGPLHPVFTVNRVPVPGRWVFALYLELPCRKTFSVWTSHVFADVSRESKTFETLSQISGYK